MWNQKELKLEGLIPNAKSVRNILSQLGTLTRTWWILHKIPSVYAVLCFCKGLV